MLKKITFILFIMILIVQFTGVLSVLANEEKSSEENTSSIPEANISVKIDYDREDRIYKDDTFPVTLILKSDIEITDVSANIDSSSAFYIPSDQYQTIELIPIDNSSLYEYSSREFSLKYKGTGNNLSINIKYRINAEEKPFTYSTTLYLDNVREKSKDKNTNDVDTSQYKPYITVWGETKIPVLQAGRSSAVPFYIKNQSRHTAKNVVISLEPTDNSSGILFNTIKATKTIDELESDSSRDLYFPVEIDPSVKTGIYSLKVNIFYTNLFHDSFQTSETIRIKVENNNSPPEISLTYMETIPEVIKPGERAKLKLQLKNMGTLPAENVKISLTGLKSDGFIVSDGISTKYLEKIDGSSTQTVEFDLICSHKMEDGYKELGVKVEYKNYDGNTKSHDSQIFLPVAASGDMNKLRDKDEEDEEVKTVPRLIINEYELSDAAVKAGKKIGVSLSFLNTSQQVPIRNLKLTFVSNDGVFTTEGSNSFFMQEVGPGKSFNKEISVFAKPDAEPKIYNLTVKLEYEDTKGNSYASEELISIPVQQDAKLVLGDLELPPESYVGQPIPIYIEFYNMGKATLHNLMIKVEGDFEEAKPSYFVGNFESGRSDYFDAMLNIYNPGEISGKVVFTFEDSAGNPTEISKDFVLNVMEMPKPPDMGEDMFSGMEPPMESQNKNKLWIWAGSIGGAVIIIILIIILRKRHNKKKGMMFDEAL